jgi:chromosome segregation ATPase
MVFNLLKINKKKDLEKRFTTFSEQLAQAFAQIKTDIGEANNRIESNQQEMERIGQWIEYLNRSNQRLAEANSRILQKHEKITENHQKLHASHRELHQEHSRTSRTAENLENSHQELSRAVSTHKNELKSELNNQFQEQREAYEKELQRLKSWVDYLSTHIDAQKRKEGDIRQDLENREKTWLETYSKLRALLNGLQSENSELKSTMANLKRDVMVAREDLENVQKTAKNNLFEAKSEFSEQIHALRNMPQTVQPQPIPQPVQQVVQKVSPTGSSFQKHIISRVMPNRKGYVLKMIMGLVEENKYSTKEIEEMVVNEKQLCGRTSFYAYLKELKLKGRLSYAEIEDRTILVSTESQQSQQTLNRLNLDDRTEE